MSKDSKNDSEVPLRDHVFDGIEELDHKLPNWWLFTLYISIFTFVVYWFCYYQLPLGMKSEPEKVEAKIAVIEQKRADLLEAMVSSLTDESLIKMSSNAENVDAGKAIYESKCVACHGAELDSKMSGVQLPGVSLVDAEWLFGGEPLKIMNTVTNGSPNIEKGMIAWKTQLAPTDIAQVVAYILSKQP